MKNTTTGYAAQLLARSRGRAPRPMPVPGLAEAPRMKAEDAAALDRTLAAGKRLDTPGRKPRRVWERMFNQIAENCEQCGRIIEPGAERYQDWVSGHLRRHVECHEKAEAKR